MSSHTHSVATDARTTVPPGSERRGGRADADAASDDAGLRRSWEERTRLVVTPIAAPSILGLFGFAASTFMVASLLAGWWSSPEAAAPVIAPFALFFGGLAQLLAAMWCYRARDGLGTGIHGTWGSFWLGWSLLVGLVTTGALPTAVLTSQAFGFWFIVLTVVTLFGAVAALGDNLALASVLWLLTAGSGLLAAGYVGGLSAVVAAGGWVLVFSAGAAFYTAGALMLAETARGRVVLPLGALDAASNVPGRRVTEPIGYDRGMPGAKVGQ